MDIDFLTTGLTAAGTAATIYGTHWLSRRAPAKKEAQAVQHLAMRIADRLEQFASSCATKVSDIETHKASREEGVIVSLPTAPVFPRDDKNWSDIDIQIGHEIQSLEDSWRAYEGKVSAACEYGDHYDGQDEARESSIMLGVEAMAVSKKIRKKYKLPTFDTRSYWPEFLADKYDELDEEKKLAPAFTFPRKVSFLQRIAGRVSNRD